MRFLTLLKSGDNSEAGPPPEGLFGAIQKLGEEAKAAGVLVDTNGLAPSADGARIQLVGGGLDAADGPFDNKGKELGSYAIYEVSSKEEVIEWASRFMGLYKEHWPKWEGEAEILRIFGAEDYM